MPFCKAIRELSGKESLQETVLAEELNVDREIRQLVLDNECSR